MTAGDEELPETPAPPIGEDAERAEFRAKIEAELASGERTGLDANDVLRAYGPKALVKTLKDAVPVPQTADESKPPRATAEQVRAVINKAEAEAKAKVGSGGNAQRPGDANSDLDRRCALRPMTDLGNAERFEARFRERFIHVPEIGWLFWDGKRWAREGSEAALSAAVRHTVRAIQGEASSIRETDADVLIDTKKTGEEVWLSDKLASWGRASEAVHKLAAIPRIAEGMMSEKSAHLDADPWKINVENGTLVIDRSRQGDPVSCVGHDPADRITKLAPVIFDPNATCPNYDRFMREVQPDPGQWRFLHKWGGYSLTGDTSEQRLVFFYGKGKNGKSTLVDIWCSVAGDYSGTAQIETFLNQGRARNAGAPTPDLADLPGVRMLRTSEPEKGAKLAEAMIKLVTGGEPIQARHLNAGFFRFRPSFKLTMSGNYMPRIDGTDEGIWRRVVLVPWLVTVEKADRELPAKLDREKSGILNRLLDGLRLYLEEGLTLPETVAEATAVYRDDSDPLGRFLQVAVEDVRDARTQSTALHQAFTAWAKGCGENEWSAKGLARAMKDRGYRQKNSHVMWWLDIRLSPDGEALRASAAPHPHSDPDER